MLPSRTAQCERERSRFFSQTRGFSSDSFDPGGTPEAGRLEPENEEDHHEGDGQRQTRGNSRPGCRRGNPPDRGSDEADHMPPTTAPAGSRAHRARRRRTRRSAGGPSCPVGGTASAPPVCRRGCRRRQPGPSRTSGPDRPGCQQAGRLGVRGDRPEGQTDLGPVRIKHRATTIPPRSTQVPMAS